MKYIFVALFLFCLAPNAWAAEAAATVPTNIKAARMEYDADKQVVVFSGSVYVKRPDFELWSDKLTVHLERNAAAAPAAREMDGMQAGRIDRIVASGHVRMQSEDKEGTCGKATYYAAKDLFVMEEKPVLRQKDNVIKGRIISHYMKAGRSEVDDPIAEFSAPDRTSSGNPFKPGGDKKEKP